MTADFESTVLDRFDAVQNAWGRAWLNCEFLLKKVYARWLASGAEVAKRVLDIAVSLCTLLILSPLFGIIALAVWMEDGGPIFFAQTRVGRYGRPFRMYKFRSMCRNAEERLKELIARNQHSEGVTFKLKDDPRITRVGRFLRKWSLDELPQFLNVFMGDMSLVGPRPPVPREVAKYSLADRRRLATKPGITCLWQISGRSEIDFSGQVRLDVQYIEEQSLALDFKILLMTVPAVLSGKGAC